MSVSTLLASFGARKTSASTNEITRRPSGHSLREKHQVSYAESSEDDSVESASHSAGDGIFSRASESVDGNDSDDELLDNDTIHVAARHRDVFSSRQQPPRATRSRRTSYVPPKTRKLKRKRKTAARHSEPILVSDTVNVLDDDETLPETARHKVRSDIATITKPKRDAFILAHKDYFLPLLPANNQIEKLERQHAMNDTLDIDDQLGTVEHRAITEQPKGVLATLKPYQLDGLSFLVHMNNNGMPAILGDEMGLGKTLQTLSLFQHLTENTVRSGENRPFLVICPLSVLSSWINEAAKWVPSLTTVRFHGSKPERDRLKVQCVPTHARGRPAKRNKKGQQFPSNLHKRVDLVVTTYETFVSEQQWFKRAFVWRYCVLDEGHKIKNEKSDVSSALQTLSAEYRLLLTGTPLQNNLREMWALLHWLLPETFTLETSDNFRKAFDLTKGTVSTSFMGNARHILELLMLRRLKNSPGVNLDLPPKEEILLYVPLTPMQRFWYTRLLTKSDSMTLKSLFSGARDKEKQAIEHDKTDQQLALLEKASAALDAGETVGDGDVWAESRAIMEQAIQTDDTLESKTAWQRLMNLLMQLRKVCVHPYMLPNAAPEDYHIGDHVKTASGKFIVLEKIIDELVLKQRKKILIFSGFTRTLDLCDDLLRLKGGNHTDAFRFGRLDGGTQRAQRNLGIRMFNDKTCNLQIMLLSTRAGGLGINLTSATDIVFMDEDWNPQMTLQAEARAHRIGQTQKVTIYKLCSQGTVEEQMMGRIRKKLYLSAKIMDSMRSVHATDSTDKKRKHTSMGGSVDDDAPQLDTASLQSLIRRGAQTLAHPEIDVTEMLNWDWETTLERCRNKPMDMTGSTQSDGADGAIDEEQWLNSVERVETAIFEGRKHHKRRFEDSHTPDVLDRSARREGKNTTVEVNGYMISKESMQCADWEAVPTFAGKYVLLAEPKREKRPPIPHQTHCQACWTTAPSKPTSRTPRSTSNTPIPCNGCPRVYHASCLEQVLQSTATHALNRFYCPQHHCAQCSAKTGEAGGLLFRCRWCPDAFCEDCLDWNTVRLLDHVLPELQTLGFGAVDQAFWVECPGCVGRFQSQDRECRRFTAAVDQRRREVDTAWREFAAAHEEDEHARSDSAPTTVPPFSYAKTPDSRDEVATPSTPLSDTYDRDSLMAKAKKPKLA